MNNTGKFNGKAAAYVSGRPRYAAKFIDMLFDNLGANARSVIADIGSGTGILTEQLLERGAKVFAVEPNDDMRASAEASLSRYPRFVSVKATAENTSLERRSVDIITVAQAFHWFSADAFKAECNRILKPNGKIFLVWNSRAENAPINIEQHKIFEKYCPLFNGFGGKHTDVQIASFFDDDYTLMEFDNPIIYSREIFIARCLSGSYAPRENDDNYTEFIAEAEKLFYRFAENGTVTVPNKTEVYFK